MEKELKIDGGEFTPDVHFSAETGKLSFGGRSMPENVGAFFNPLIEWVKEYVSSPAENTTLEIFFEYYNSSTARRLTELIYELEALKEAGKNVKVLWLYKAGDVVMKENGEEIQSVVDLDFELKEA